DDGAVELVLAVAAHTNDAFTGFGHDRLEGSQDLIAALVQILVLSPRRTAGSESSRRHDNDDDVAEMTRGERKHLRVHSEFVVLSPRIAVRGPSVDYLSGVVAF